MTGKYPVRSVAIRFLGYMILVKTWPECVFKVYIGSSYVGVVSGILVELMFFRNCFMFLFDVSM